jgi:hypothetical protein
MQKVNRGGGPDNTATGTAATTTPPAMRNPNPKPNPRPRPFFTMRLSPAEHDRLASAARAENTSMANYIRRRIDLPMAVMGPPRKNK